MRDQARGRTSQAIAAKTKDGQPGHTNALEHGFYSDRFTLEELTLIAGFTEAPTLTHEIWLQRVLNRRLAKLLARKTISQGSLIKVAAALAVGTGRVARLLRDQELISAEAAEGLGEAVANALGEIAAESGLKV